MTDIGSWGFKGAQRRGLELPSGSSVALSQSGRATLRYNESTNDLEVSRDGAAYEAIDIGGVPAGSPWSKVGTVIREATLTDTVAIGVATMVGSEQLRVVGDQLFDNDNKLQWRDSGGTVRDVLTFDASNDIVLGNVDGHDIELRADGRTVSMFVGGNSRQVRFAELGGGGGASMELANGAGARGVVVAVDAADDLILGNTGPVIDNVHIDFPTANFFRIRPGGGVVSMMLLDPGGISSISDEGGAARFRFSTTGLAFFNLAPVAQPAAYTITNPATRRSFDTTTVTLSELAEVVGTVIADMQAYGLLQ
jgi:hypothetical protein